MKEAAPMVACAGIARGYYSQYGNLVFYKEENHMFRLYSNCGSSYPEPATDEVDEI